MRYISLTIVFFLVHALSFGQSDKHQQIFEEVIGKNMEFKNALHEKDFFSRKTRRRVDIYVLPLNREVIDATLNYRRSIGDLKRSEKKRILKESHEKYLNGEFRAFVLLIHKYSASGKDFDLSFEDFENLTLLSDEMQDYPMLRYTKIFDEPISLGWSKGYLYFPNFRNGQHHDSYTVHLAPLNHETISFAFDGSEVDFLAFLEEGIPHEDFQRTWYLDDVAFGPDDLYKLAATIISIIGLM